MPSFEVPIPWLTFASPAPCALRPSPFALRPAPCALRPAPCAPAHLRPGAPAPLAPAPLHPCARARQPLRLCGPWGACPAPLAPLRGHPCALGPRPLHPSPLRGRACALNRHPCALGPRPLHPSPLRGRARALHRRPCAPCAPARPPLRPRAAAPAPLAPARPRPRPEPPPLRRHPCCDPKPQHAPVGTGASSSRGSGEGQVNCGATRPVHNPDSGLSGRYSRTHVRAVDAGERCRHACSRASARCCSRR